MVQNVGRHRAGPRMHHARRQPRDAAELSRDTRRHDLCSYDWLDRLIGYLDAPSADRILPEWQLLAVGDEIPIGRGGGVLGETNAQMKREAASIAGRASKRPCANICSRFQATR